MKKAIIFGVTGQDGSYLAEFLLEKGYQVVGTIRNVQAKQNKNIAALLDKIQIRIVDLSQENGVENIIGEFEPDEVYNLAGHSSVMTSWKYPLQTAVSTGLAPVRMLEAIRIYTPKTRFYQASTSEMFGNIKTYPQNEDSYYFPRNPYGIAKMNAHLAVRNYRNYYQLFAATGILYNHESPRRSEDFVSKKIVSAAVRIKLGLQDKLELGNIDSTRDWGYAPEYVQVMWKILQQDTADDFVIGTGQSHSVREFCKRVFETLDLNYLDFIIQRGDLKRRYDDTTLVADSAKAARVLNWIPQVGFEDLIKILVGAELERYKA